MNAELFIAKQLLSSKDKKNNISGPIVKIAVIGITLSIIVMILAVCILSGFKTEIRNKLLGFASHIQIVNYDSNISYETAPIYKDSILITSLSSISGIKHIQSFAIKPGVIRTKKESETIVLKGIDKNFDWSFFKNYIKKGKLFEVNDSSISKKILISEYTASLLELEVQDTIIMFFIKKEQYNLKARKFEIAGIYNTSLNDFDKLFGLVDIANIQDLNGWNHDQISGLEITINDFDKLNEYTSFIYDQISFQPLDENNMLRVTNIMYKYPHIFDWLSIVDANVWVILILLILVSSFNMVSGLLIMILERVNMIGVLKSFGYKNSSIKNIFLYLSGFLVNKGLLWGNIIGISVCLIQKYFKIFKLTASNYFLDAVPIKFNILHIVLLNIGTLTIIVIMLILPSLIIAKISPEKTIKFN